MTKRYPTPWAPRNFCITLIICSPTFQRLVRPRSVSRLASDHLKANVSATRAVPLAQLDVVDRNWRRRLPGPPFPAAQSSRNEPVRLDQRFSEDRLPALRVEGGDAMQLRLPPAAQLLPSERRYLHTPRRLEP